MTWRSQRDESKFTNAEKIAWDFVLPYQHLYILDYDTNRANSLAKKLEKVFTEEALRDAAHQI